MIPVIKCTFKEMFHKKALFFMLILTACYLLLYGLGIKEVYKSVSRINFALVTISSEFITIGLYFASLIVAFLVVISSAGALSGDVESGAIQAVLVKPIKRYEVVLGKFFGIGFMVSLYSLFLFFSIIFLNKAFGAKVALNFNQLLSAALLFVWMQLVLISVCLWGSARMSTLGAGILAAMLFGFALIGGWLEQIGNLISVSGNDSAAGLINAGIIASLLMPTDALYRKMTSVLFSSGGINLMSNSILGAGAEPSLYMLLYAAAYTVFMIYSAARSFSSRDI